MLHPETKEKIPLAFRMSMFMPSNLPITAGMLLSGTVRTLQLARHTLRLLCCSIRQCDRRCSRSLMLICWLLAVPFFSFGVQGPAQLFWQWLNQSYNAGFNYANRNASVPLDTKQLALSYGVATGVAVGMSAALGKVVNSIQQKVGGSGPQPLSLKLLMRGLPWMAVASAGMANAIAMRYKEGIDGISIYDEKGALQGTSVAAGRAALLQIALTRAALPVPILLLPPFILDAIRAAPGIGAAMARSAPVRLTVELSVFALFLQGALPFAVALFPQTGTIDAEALEPQFRDRKDADGNRISRYTYNKGV